MAASRGESTLREMTTLVATDWVALARELGPGFAARAMALDTNDSFPTDNYRELKKHRFFGAGVPIEPVPTTLADVQAAMSSAETGAVMGDIPNYTNTSPIISTNTVSATS